MREVARWMDEIVTAQASGNEDTVEKAVSQVHGEVSEITGRFPVPGLDR